jgi:glycosyltransferase involved in cell wall biosynthesis
MSDDSLAIERERVAQAPFKDILIVSQYYAPEPGAPQIRLRNMAAQLTQLGVKVRVLTGMPNYPLGRIFDGYRRRLFMKETIDGIPVSRIWLYPAAGRAPVRRLLNYLSFTLLALPAVLFSRKPDLIFVEAQPLVLAIPAWLTKCLRGVPYVYNTPDLQVEVAKEGGWIGLQWFIALARGLEGFLMRNALTVTTVTHAFIDHFIESRHIARSKMSFLPNGADTDRLKPMPRNGAYAERMGVGSRKVFTYAGTHAHYQGLEVIVEAADRLRDREDIVILMVGNGPVREQLMRSASERGLGNLIFQQSPFEEMACLMSITTCSLVVLRDMAAARKMRLSKAIPPLACGVPLIYAGEGETAEIVRRERCGLVVQPERPELLAAAIRKVADDPVLRSSMGARGRALAEREFSWKSIVRDWYRQICCIQRGEEPAIIRPGGN